MFIFESEMSEFDKKFAINMKNAELDLASIVNEFELCRAMNSMYTESDDKPKEKLSLFGHIKKFVGRIIKIIADFIDSIGEIFSGKEELSAEEYFGSDTLQEKFESDYQNMEKTVRKKLAEGNTLIRGISSVTGVDADEVQTYVNGVSSTLSTVSKVAIPFVTAWGVRKLIKKSEEDNKKSIQQAQKDAEKAATDEKKQGLIMSVLGAMGEYAKAGVTSGKNFISNIAKKAKPGKGEEAESNDGDTASANKDNNTPYTVPSSDVKKLNSYIEHQVKPAIRSSNKVSNMSDDQKNTWIDASAKSVYSALFSYMQKNHKGFDDITQTQISAVMKQFID